MELTDRLRRDHDSQRNKKAIPLLFHVHFLLLFLGQLYNVGMTAPKDINFLVVDDYFSIRKAVKVSLRNLGFSGEIFEADSITRARDLLSIKESTSKIQFIISDLQMPGGTGIELLQFVRNSHQFKNLPFLMLSSVNDKNQILEAISNGVSSYLFKPWDDKSIESKITNSWLKHGQ